MVAEDTSLVLHTTGVGLGEGLGEGVITGEGETDGLTEGEGVTVVEGVVNLRRTMSSIPSIWVAIVLVVIHLMWNGKY